jgi:hypothetical protein
MHTVSNPNSNKDVQCGGRSISACSSGRRSVVADQLGDSLHCAFGDYEALSFLFLECVVAGHYIRLCLLTTSICSSERIA